MTIITEAPATTRSVRVMRRKGNELRAMIDGKNIYAQFTGPDGRVQYPAWNPIDREFDLWDAAPDTQISAQLDSAWYAITQHPAMHFAA